MTDLEWLARNVREWPKDGHTHVRVDDDGEVCFEGAGSVDHDFYPIGVDGYKGSGSVYTEPQWLAKRAELGLVNDVVVTPQWNGEGLPPVGCEVEVSTGWPSGKMRVVYVCEKRSEVCLSYNDGHCVRNVIDVSPLKPERQKIAEELASFLDGVLDECAINNICMDIADYLYDQGYRKTN